DENRLDIYQRSGNTVREVMRKAQRLTDSHKMARLDYALTNLTTDGNR
ncbi:hypothetical protein V3C99_002442, partial [Haemonchus contortus]